MALYQPLDATRNTIRLLRILPADDDDTLIRCMLQEMDLDGDLTYIALSYAWDRAGLPSVISVNDFEVKITKNLESALLHL